jgi:hypothetical protein
MRAFIEFLHMVGTEAECLVCLMTALAGSPVRAQALKECTSSVNIAPGVERGHGPGRIEEMFEVRDGSGHFCDRGERYTNINKDDASAAPIESHWSLLLSYSGDNTIGLLLRQCTRGDS